MLKNALRLKPNMLARVTKFVNEYFGENSFVIGIHIRSEYVDEADIDKFTNCAHEIEKELRSQMKDSQVKWFITSDIDSVLFSSVRKKFVTKSTRVLYNIMYFGFRISQGIAGNQDL